ncbi:hypothetical protein CEXT_97851 [Caerostris extrusa]|uniref:Uncharacterized protein n=1 Tax=Caerostris extrusa TaxID=172846 RepID=A0AAV4NAQ0_CAEEX|nr:hypothetical protein CEXT_97851 [Caerostris extrusa]
MSGEAIKSRQRQLFQERNNPRCNPSSIRNFAWNPVISPPLPSPGKAPERVRAPQTSAAIFLRMLFLFGFGTVVIFDSVGQKCIDETCCCGTLVRCP